MSHRMTILLTALSVCALGACDRQKSAAEVHKDTAAAEQSAAEHDAKAEEKADQKLASAAGDVREEQRDMQHTGAVQAERVADTQAEGAHKIALARCEGLASNAQRACKDQADADYQAATATAKQERSQSDPKP